MSKEKEHRWSGWPGAYCLDCGQEDLMELAIGQGLYDPYLDRWKSEEIKIQYTQQPCKKKDEYG